MALTDTLNLKLGISINITQGNIRKKMESVKGIFASASKSIKKDFTSSIASIRTNLMNITARSKIEADKIIANVNTIASPFFLLKNVSKAFRNNLVKDLKEITLNAKTLKNEFISMQKLTAAKLGKRKEKKIPGNESEILKMANSTSILRKETSALANNLKSLKKNLQENIKDTIKNIQKNNESTQSTKKNRFSIISLASSLGKLLIFKRKNTNATKISTKRNRQNTKSINSGNLSIKRFAKGILFATKKVFLLGRSMLRLGGKAIGISKLSRGVTRLRGTLIGSLAASGLIIRAIRGMIRIGIRMSRFFFDAFIGFADFEDQLVTIARKANLSAAQMDFTNPKSQINKLKDEFLKLNAVLPVTLKQIAATAIQGKTLGIAFADLPKFTESVIKFSLSSNLGFADAAKQLGRLSNVLGERIPGDSKKTALGFKKLASVIIVLGREAAATESEIINVALRSGFVGRTLGLTSGEVLAFSAQLKNLGLTSQVAGTNLAKVLVDFFDPNKLNQISASVRQTMLQFKKGLLQAREDKTLGIFIAQFLKDLKNGTTNGEQFIGKLTSIFGKSKRTLQVLLALSDKIKESGGNVKNLVFFLKKATDESGKFKSASAIVDNIRKLKKEFKSLKSNNAFEEIANSARKLVLQTTILKRKMQLKEFKKNTSLQLEFTRSMKSLRKQIDIISSKFDNLKKSLINGLRPAFAKLLKILGKVLDFFLSLTPQVKKIISIIGILTSVLITLTGILFTLSLFGFAMKALGTGLLGVVTALFSIIFSIQTLFFGVLFGVVVTTIAAILSTTIKSGKTIGDFFKNLSTTINKSFIKFKIIFQKIFNSLKPTIQKAKQDILNSFKAIRPEIIKVLSSLKSIKKSDISKIFTSFIKLFTKFAIFVIKLTPSILKLFIFLGKIFAFIISSIPKIFNPILNFIQNIFNEFSNIKKTIRNIDIDPLSNSIKQLISSKPFKILKNIGKIISKQFSNIKLNNNFLDLFKAKKKEPIKQNKFRQNITPVFGIIVPKKTSFFESIGKSIENVIFKIRDLLKKFKDFTGIEISAKTISNSFENLFKIFKRIGKILKPIFDSIKKGLPFISSFIKGLVIGFGKTKIAVFEGLIIIIKGIVSVIKSVILSIKNLFKAASDSGIDLNKVFLTIGKAIGIFLAIFGVTFISTLLPSLATIGAILTPIVAIFAISWPAAIISLTALFALFANSSKNIKKSFSNLFEGIFDLDSNKITSSLDDIISNIEKIFSNTINKLQNKITKLFSGDSISSTFGDFINDIIDNLKDSFFLSFKIINDFIKIIIKLTPFILKISKILVKVFAGAFIIISKVVSSVIKTILRNTKLLTGGIFQFFSFLSSRKEQIFAFFDGLKRIFIKGFSVIFKFINSFSFFDSKSSIFTSFDEIQKELTKKLSTLFDLFDILGEKANAAAFRISGVDPLVGLKGFKIQKQINKTRKLFSNLFFSQDSIQRTGKDVIKIGNMFSGLLNNLRSEAKSAVNAEEFIDLKSFKSTIDILTFFSNKALLEFKKIPKKDTLKKEAFLTQLKQQISNLKKQITSKKLFTFELGTTFSPRTIRTSKKLIETQLVSMNTSVIAVTKSLSKIGNNVKAKKLIEKIKKISILLQIMNDETKNINPNNLQQFIKLRNLNTLKTTSLLLRSVATDIKDLSKTNLKKFGQFTTINTTMRLFKQLTGLSLINMTQITKEINNILIKNRKQLSLDKKRKITISILKTIIDKLTISQIKLDKQFSSNNAKKFGQGLIRIISTNKTFLKDTTKFSNIFQKFLNKLIIAKKMTKEQSQILLFNFKNQQKQLKILFRLKPLLKQISNKDIIKNKTLQESFISINKLEKKLKSIKFSKKELNLKILINEKKISTTQEVNILKNRINNIRKKLIQKTVKFLNLKKNQINTAFQNNNLIKSSKLIDKYKNKLNTLKNFIPSTNEQISNLSNNIKSLQKEQIKLATIQINNLNKIAQQKLKSLPFLQESKISARIKRIKIIIKKLRLLNSDKNLSNIKNPAFKIERLLNKFINTRQEKNITKFLFLQFKNINKNRKIIINNLQALNNPRKAIESIFNKKAINTSNVTQLINFTKTLTTKNKDIGEIFSKTLFKNIKISELKTSELEKFINIFKSVNINTNLTNKLQLEIRKRNKLKISTIITLNDLINSISENKKDFKINTLKRILKPLPLTDNSIKILESLGVKENILNKIRLKIKELRKNKDLSLLTPKKQSFLNATIKQRLLFQKPEIIGNRFGTSTSSEISDISPINGIEAQIVPEFNTNVTRIQRHEISLRNNDVNFKNDTMENTIKNIFTLLSNGIQNISENTDQNIQINIPVNIDGRKITDVVHNIIRKQKITSGKQIHSTDGFI